MGRRQLMREACNGDTQDTRMVSYVLRQEISQWVEMSCGARKDMQAVSVTNTERF